MQANKTAGAKRSYTSRLATARTMTEGGATLKDVENKYATMKKSPDVSSKSVAEIMPDPIDDRIFASPDVETVREAELSKPKKFAPPWTANEKAR